MRPGEVKAILEVGVKAWDLTPGLCSGALRVCCGGGTAPKMSFHVALHPSFTLPLVSPAKTPFLKVCREGNVFFSFKKLFSFAVSFILT